jgi:hypothetical protein
MVLRYLMTRTWMSVLCLFVLVPIAAFDYFAHLPDNLCSRANLQGANIDLACGVVAFSGFAALLVTASSLVVGNDLAKDRFRRELAVLLFVEAGALAFAIGLVLADSATYIALTGYDINTSRCPVPHPVGSHVYGLLTVVSLSLLFVLLRAFGAWTGVERRDPKQRPRRTSELGGAAS